MFDKFGVLSSFVFSLVREYSICNYLTFSRYEKTALKFDYQKIYFLLTLAQTAYFSKELINLVPCRNTTVKTVIYRL